MSYQICGVTVINGSADFLDIGIICNRAYNLIFCHVSYTYII